MIWAVDRIEEDQAVLEDPDTMTTTPYKLSDLPRGVKEGDVLINDNGKWRIDKDARAQRAAQLTERFNNLINKGNK